MLENVASVSVNAVSHVPNSSFNSLSPAKTKNAYEINNIQGNRVTCYMDDISRRAAQPLSPSDWPIVCGAQGWGSCS